MSLVQDILSRFRGEIGGNRRLQMGMMFIVLLIAMYGIGGLSSMRARISSEYVQDMQRLERVRHIAREKGWDKRAEDAQQLLTQLQAQIPQSDSVGLAQATFQGWLRGAAIATDPKLDIHMGTPQQVSDGSDYWEIPAQLAGSLPRSRALEIVRKIESRGDLAVIRRIRLSVVSPNSLTLDVVAYYRIPKQAGRP